jgi:type VI secretion system protein ImpM
MPAPAGGLRRFALDEDVGARVVAAALEGHSVWWSDGAPGVEPSMLVCRGVPQAQAFSALLDGAWT